MVLRASKLSHHSDVVGADRRPSTQQSLRQGGTPTRSQLDETTTDMNNNNNNSSSGRVQATARSDRRISFTPDVLTLAHSQRDRSSSIHSLHSTISTLIDDDLSLTSGEIWRSENAATHSTRNLPPNIPRAALASAGSALARRRDSSAYTQWDQVKRSAERLHHVRARQHVGLRAREATPTFRGGLGLRLLSTDMYSPKRPPLRLLDKGSFAMPKGTSASPRAGLIGRTGTVGPGGARRRSTVVPVPTDGEGGVGVGLKKCATRLYLPNVQPSHTNPFVIVTRGELARVGVSPLEQHRASVRELMYMEDRELEVDDLNDENSADDRDDPDGDDAEAVVGHEEGDDDDGEDDDEFGDPDPEGVVHLLRRRSTKSPNRKRRSTTAMSCVSRSSLAQSIQSNFVFGSTLEASGVLIERERDKLRAAASLKRATTFVRKAQALAKARKEGRPLSTIGDDSSTAVESSTSTSTSTAPLVPARSVVVVAEPTSTSLIHRVDDDECNNNNVDGNEDPEKEAEHARVREQLRDTRFDSHSNVARRLASSLDDYDEVRHRRLALEIRRKRHASQVSEAERLATFLTNAAQGKVTIRAPKELQSQRSVFTLGTVRTAQQRRERVIEEEHLRRQRDEWMRKRMNLLRFQRAVGKLILQNRAKRQNLGSVAQQLLAELRIQRLRRDKEAEIRRQAQQRALSTVAFFEHFTRKGRREISVHGLTEDLYRQLYNRVRDMDVERTGRVYLDHVIQIVEEGGRSFDPQAFYRVDKERSGFFVFRDVMKILFPDATSRQVRTLHQLYEATQKKERHVAPAETVFDVLSPESVEEIKQLFKRYDKNRSGLIYRRDIEGAFSDVYWMNMVRLENMFPTPQSSLTLKDFTEVMKWSYPPYSDRT
eukprot:PhM_4_TR17948/c0_g1_i1/m.82672